MAIAVSLNECLFTVSSLVLKVRFGVILKMMYSCLMFGFYCLFILCVLRAFPSAEKRGKKPLADEKAGEC
jgi:type IV secretory pathway TrbL component